MTPFELVTLGLLSLACACAVYLTWAARAPRVNPDQVDVDELAIEVARIAKQVRRDRMSAVRAGESSPQNPAVAGPPPELRQEVPPLATGQLTKDQLRRLASSRH